MLGGVTKSQKYIEYRHIVFNIKIDWLVGEPQ